MPPQTSQRHWPVPLHSLHLPIVMPAIDCLPLPPQRVQQVILWPCHLGHKNLFRYQQPLLFPKDPEIEATDTFSLLSDPKGRTTSLATQLGDLACHQMYFAASASRPPTTMTNTTIWTQTLFAKP